MSNWVQFDDKKPFDGEDILIAIEKYDKENPEIWNMFKKIAIEAKREKGFKHYSANGIFEIIRWETKVSGKDGFKVNNNFRADYARKLMAQDPYFHKLGVSIDMLGTEDNTPEEILSGNAILEGVKQLIEELIKNDGN